MLRASFIGALTTGCFIACSAGDNGEDVGFLGQPVVDRILLSEVKIDPPGAAWTNQFIELRGTPGESLAGYYVAVVSGTGNAAGTVNFLVNLGTACGAEPCEFGTNGLLLITKPGGHTAPSATTTVVTNDDDDFGFGPAPVSSRSLLLISSETNPIVLGTDYDATNDGTLELPAGASIVDAIGWETNPGHDVYGGVTLPALDSGVPDAASRFPDNGTPLSLAAWYYGELAGISGTSLTYNPSQSSSNLPPGGSLTPAAENEGDGVGGAGGAGGGGGAGGAAGDAGTGGTTPGGGTAGTSPVGGAGGGSAGADEGGVGGAPVAGEAGSGGVPAEEGGAGGTRTEGGTTSDGGVAGEAGAQPTAGTSPSGGSSGSGAGTAGRSSGGTAGQAVAGRAGDGGADPGSDLGDDDDDDDGCSCSTPGHASSSNALIMAAFAALAAVMRRRRRDER